MIWKSNLEASNASDAGTNGDPETPTKSPLNAPIPTVDLPTGIDHANEEWRPIPDWPYEVSNHGRVRRARDGKIVNQCPPVAGLPAGDSRTKESLL